MCMTPDDVLRALLNGDFNHLNSEDDPDYTEASSDWDDLSSRSSEDGDGAEAESNKENGITRGENIPPVKPATQLSFSELALHPRRPLDIPLLSLIRPRFTNEQYLEAAKERQAEYQRLLKVLHMKTFISLPAALLAEAALREAKKDQDGKLAEAKARLADAKTQRDDAISEAVALLERTIAVPASKPNGQPASSDAATAAVKVMLSSPENVIQILDRLAAHVNDPAELPTLEQRDSAQVKNPVELPALKGTLPQVEDPVESPALKGRGSRRSSRILSKRK